jgi:hypothetical protein
MCDGLGRPSGQHVSTKKEGYKMIQLQDLAKRLPEKWIQEKGTGFAAKYCSHGDIQQALLAKVGPTSQRVVKIIHAPEGNIIQGVILEMRFYIDLEPVVIEEIGECERPTDNNALNLKNSVSDAIKRCCMRVGLGLELWATEHYALDKALAKRAEQQEAEELAAE